MSVSMAGNMNERVKIRLIKFLLKDKLGIRKYLLKLFLQAKSCTTGEVYDYLIKQGFNVNYRGVSAMVGQMHSRLGILRVYSANKRNVYTLKENYLNVVKMVLTPFTTGI
jgi:hypothetical protein